MLPACRSAGAGFTMPTFDVVSRAVEGCMDGLWAFQSAVHAGLLPCKYVGVACLYGTS
jgi:hypothetical protein